MRAHVLTLSVCTALLAGCTPTPKQVAQAEADAAATRAKLGKELAGLTPSGTTDCLNNFPQMAMKSFGSTLVYSNGKSVKYVTDTGGGCEGTNRGDILVTVSPTGRLCRGDIARTVMAQTRVPTGSCAIGDFTVYRKDK